MSYINKKNEPLVNVKLTDIGRRNLANGKLTFSKYSLGDSEMDYRTNDYSLQNILRPADNQQGLIYQIASQGETYLNTIGDIQSVPVVIENTAEERGFFTTGGTINDDLCKVYALQYSISGLTGGTSITVSSFSGSTISGETITSASTIDINAGDLLLLKLSNEYYGSASESAKEILPYLWFEIQDTVSGFTGGTTTFTVDRTLPDTTLSTGTTSGVSYVYVYPSDVTYYDEENPVAYWGDDYLNFSTNCSNTDDNVKVWNMNIVHLEDIIGVDDILYKGLEDSLSYNYRGMYTYLKYSELNSNINKIGIIHYSNNSVSNYYGEGLTYKNFEITLPTLMWHKQQFGSVGGATSIGYTFVCDSTLKKIDNTLRYYDIIDQEDTPTIVGKMFPDLKVVVIEHPELLMAMSLKSNRNWTLPKPSLRLTEAGICPGSTNKGIIGVGEALHVTYLLKDTNGYLNGMHCEDYTTITSEQVSDVLFQFPKKDNSTTYNEFPYYRKVENGGTGWYADDFIILMQKTLDNEKPRPTDWKYFNATSFIGGDGCISTSIELDNEVELYKETKIISDINIGFYELDYEPVGDIIVSVNGVVQKEATSVSNIFRLDPSDPDYSTYAEVMGDYAYVRANNRVYFKLNQSFYPNGAPTTELQVGDTVQFHYLKGASDAAATIKQNIFVPTPIPNGTSGEIYLDTPINTGVTIPAPSPVLDLDDTPSGTVYVFYNGQVLSSSNYYVVNNGGTWRVELNFVPSSGSRIILYYLSGTVLASGSTITTINATDLNDTKVYLNHEIYNTIASGDYTLNDFITIPDSDNTDKFSFGDEQYFFGNLATDIKATIYKSKTSVLVLPDRFVSSQNPTFNSNLDTVAITEIGIYDEDNDLVGIGKFSQPLTRQNNADTLVINVTIDI